MVMQDLKSFLVRGTVMTCTAMLLSSCEQANTVVHAVKNRLYAFITTNSTQEALSLIPMVTGVKVTKNVMYGAHEKQQVDVYAPVNAQHAPIIMMLHGGGWSGGDNKDQLSYINKVNRWVPKDFIVISADTRLLPEADVYEQVDDLARAISYVQKHAVEWGGDGRKLILMGHSSAGTMVAALAAHPATVTQYGGEPWLGSVALDSTSLDIPRAMRLWAPGMIARAYGDESTRWLNVSPINLLNKTSLSMLLACSTQRGDAPCEQASLFAEQAKKFGIMTKVIPQDYDHGGVDFNLGLDAEYTQSVESFMANLDSEVARLLDMTREN